MATVKYKSSKEIELKREQAKDLTNEELINEFKNECLSAVAHGHFQLSGWPFVNYSNGKADLLWSGERYQVFKEEMLQRMSVKTKG